MCEPISIAMGIMGVAGAASEASAAGAAARNQGEYNRRLSIWQNERYQSAVDYQYKLAAWQEENYYKTAAAAKDSATGQYSAVMEQVDQVRDRTLENIARTSRAASKGRSFATASAAETGTGGSSIRLAQQQYELAEARSTHISYKNLKNSVNQAKRNMLGIQAQTQNIINRAMPAPMSPIDPVQPIQQVQSPSMLPYLIQGGSSIIGAAAYQQNIDAGNLASGNMTGVEYNNRWGFGFGGSYGGMDYGGMNYGGPGGMPAWAGMMA
tara:strand:+ start:294 stop:1094 length:801 start_codon:yes stop_codon:yes gene_type:complete